MALYNTSLYNELPTNAFIINFQLLTLTEAVNFSHTLTKPEAIFFTDLLMNNVSNKGLPETISLNDWLTVTQNEPPFGN